MSRFGKDFSGGAADRDPDFEPFERGNPIPWPLIAVALALICWGALTIWRDADVAPEGEARQTGRGSLPSEASASESAATRHDAGTAERHSAETAGAALFGEYCATCHQANGSGVRAAIPPLDGSRYVLAPAEVPVTILLRGITGPIEVGGEVYDGRMPTFGATLSDSRISAILTYVRAAWSNDAAPVSENQVAALRADLGDNGLRPLAGGAEIADRFGVGASVASNQPDGGR